jgi:hypothetical protein
MHSKWMIIAGLILALVCFAAGCSSASADQDISAGGDEQTQVSATEQQTILTDFEALLQSDNMEKEDQLVGFIHYKGHVIEEFRRPNNMCYFRCIYGVNVHESIEYNALHQMKRWIDGNV